MIFGTDDEGLLVLGTGAVVGSGERQLGARQAGAAAAGRSPSPSPERGARAEGGQRRDGADQREGKAEGALDGGAQAEPSQEEHADLPHSKSNNQTGNK